jgi:phosphoribosylaminoimidazolecarboxamide formyltransferase/IMP cyclohydrolase
MINRVEFMDDELPLKNVLVSVSDKAGLEDLIPALRAANPEVRFFSTGGTYDRLKTLLGPDYGDSLVSVSDYTGQPEMQGGLVKTLDFKIYLGILSETHNPAHQEDLARCGAVSLDMVVVNLYPFVQTVARPGADLEDARGNIDIGGPCMLRAAAKNFLRVAPVCDPADYSVIIEELTRRQGCLGAQTRYYLARKAFAHTAAYDTAIAAYLVEHDFSAAAALYRPGPTAPTPAAGERS